jgi:hypothetical protein
MTPQPDGLKTKLSKQKMKEIDTVVDNFPVFLTTQSTDLTEFIIKYPGDFTYNYDIPEEEFNYRSDLVENMSCMVYLPKLFERLRSLNIDDEQLKQLQQEAYDAINPEVPLDELQSLN